MDARHADKLKMDWWYGTVLPTNWKLAMEAFMEGYHVMETHPQLYALTPRHNDTSGDDGKGLAPPPMPARETVNMHIDFLARLGAGMAGMVHQTEIDVAEKLRDMDLPEDVGAASAAFYKKLREEIKADSLARGAPMFDLPKVAAEVEFHAVEYMFPHFFLLPMLGAMSSYRIRPLTAETCLFEIWSLVLRPEGEAFDTPTEPTILPYNSPDFPEIPKQDYANLPIQQLGLHAGEFDFMRLSKTNEGLISNYHRLIDGYLAELDPEKLVKANHVVNQGFEAPIADIGF